MKKIIAAVITIAFSLSCYSQTMRGTVKPGGQANSVYLVIRSSGAFTSTPTNLQFTLAVPKSVGTRPVLSVRANRYSAYLPDAGITLVQTASYSNDYIYLINFSQPTFASKNFLVNAEDTVAEVSFAGTFGILSAIKLVQLPNGTATSGAGEENGNYNFYTEFGGNDLTNVTAMFYTATSGTLNNNAAGYAAFSSINVGSGVLPVKWLWFILEKQQRQVKLQWRVIEDDQTDSYQIERSGNGTGFTKIGTVVRANNARGEITYTYFDSLITSQDSRTLYYRIRQTDKDGRVMYSEIRQVSINNSQLQLYPNPAKHGFYVMFKSASVGDVTLKLLAADGVMVKTQKLSKLPVGPYYFTLPSNLPKGQYYLQLYDEHMLITTEKITVQ